MGESVGSIRMLGIVALQSRLRHSLKDRALDTAHVLDTHDAKSLWVWIVVHLHSVAQVLNFGFVHEEHFGVVISVCHAISDANHFAHCNALTTEDHKLPRSKDDADFGVLPFLRRDDKPLFLFETPAVFHDFHALPLSKTLAQ